MTMYYDALSRNTVKITLTREDMKDWSIKTESLRARTADSKRRLTSVLRKLQSENAVFPDHKAERLFLEAFPSDDGGCIMYVSTLGTDLLPSEPEKKCKTLMCITRTFTDLTGLCAGLPREVRASALYRLGNGYCLILKTSVSGESAVSHIIREYGELSDDPLDIACAAEHGSVICASGAVSVIRGLC